MFGYIRPLQGELKVKEYEFYRGVYCGLCRALKTNAGCLAPFTLSYDFVFLSLVRTSLVGEPIEVSKKRCTVHPFSKRTSVSFDQLGYCAAASACAVESKLGDDRADGDLGIKALCCPFARHMRRTAEKRAGVDASLNTAIAEACVKLRTREKEEPIPSPDEAAEISGEMTAAMFEHGLEGANARIAHEIGRHIGRWVYLVDAADDFEDDIKKKRFNPFAKESGDAWKQRLRTSLLLELDAASKAVGLIEFSDRGIENIVKNIIYLGMPDAAEKVLNPKAAGKCAAETKQITEQT